MAKKLRIVKKTTYEDEIEEPKHIITKDYFEQHDQSPEAYTYQETMDILVNGVEGGN